MSKHTSGPWCVRDLPTQQRYIGPSQDGGAPSVALVLARVNVPDKRLAADASLIAAAPELFDALCLAVEAMKRSLPNGLTGDAEKAACAAIAKATGSTE